MLTDDPTSPAPPAARSGPAPKSSRAQFVVKLQPFDRSAVGRLEQLVGTPHTAQAIRLAVARLLTELERIKRTRGAGALEARIKRLLALAQADRPTTRRTGKKTARAA
jgi:hypothetical protein